MSHSTAPTGRATAPRTGLRRLAGAPGFAPLVMLVGLVAVWQVCVRVLDVPFYLLPAPSDIWTAGVDNWGLLWSNALVTLAETLVGFALSAVVGVLLAVVMVAWPLAGRALYPVLVASQVIPKVAIAPLFVVWIGTGVTTSSLIAFVMAFFPVVVNATQGLNSVSEGSLHLMRSMGASQWQVFRYLRLPSALPFIITGLQLAIAFAIVGAIVGEFVGSDSGLGYLLIVTQGNLMTDTLFAALVVLTAMGLLLYYGVELLGRLVIRWK
ncbi:ABC transporter permease [Nocardiopsis ansamitocini]|uniref:ABC transporter permease n=1 Tax=Nocardiopsis ansamitocini TaxID=1670832 RepID=A0A9W6P835_9ACTN|nr:ABC transporter permease [Nocardiopsis ansamitocini]GLU48742.1 ABC transporter permease [Nocardiopsis ansamitocini]